MRADRGFIASARPADRDVAARRDPRALAGLAALRPLLPRLPRRAGDGHGPAAPYTWGRPRAFTRGDYEWRSTPIGAAADRRRSARDHPVRRPRHVDAGLRRACSTAAQIDQLIDVVAGVRARGVRRPRAGAVALGAPPPVRPARGAVLWTQLGCDSVPRRRAATATARPRSALAPTAVRPDGASRCAAPAPPTTPPRAAAPPRYVSIATGLAGTAMPGYADQVADEPICGRSPITCVALGAGAAPHRPRRARRRTTIAADRAPRTSTTGLRRRRRRSAPRRACSARAIAPQGPPPAALAPAEASLRRGSAARCHAKQVREWRGLAPRPRRGLAGASRAAARRHGAPGATCRRCHAPLAEQRRRRPRSTPACAARA